MKNKIDESDDLVQYEKNEQLRQALCQEEDRLNHVIKAIEVGADIDLNYGLALRTALEDGDFKLTKYLIEHNVNRIYLNKIVLLPVGEITKVIDYLINQSFNLPQSFLRSSLEIAAEMNEFQLVEKLILKGAVIKKSFVMKNIYISLEMKEWMNKVLEAQNLAERLNNDLPFSTTQIKNKL